MSTGTIFLAGPVGLVRTILILAAVYFIFRIIGRFVMPWLARKAGEKMQQKMQDEMRRRAGHHQQQQQHRKEGEITIEYTDKNKPKKTSSASSRVGEYIDYEEVD